MLGSGVLEVALGLVFVYLIFALFMTSLQEALEIWLKTRASSLEQGIKQLLDDSDAVTAFYKSAPINALFNGDYGKVKSRDLPSYIPSQSFARAVMSLSSENLKNSQARNIIDNVRKQFPNLEADKLAEQTAAALQTWFDSTMDRVAGVYKRTTQIRILILSAIVAIGLNVNTLTIVQSLSQDQALRTAIAAQAEAEVKVPTTEDHPATVKDLQERYGEIEKLGLPIGWSARNQEVARNAVSCSGEGAKAAPGLCWAAAGGGVQLFIGWLLTAIAISLGAPFWFDVLNKVMVIRSTVKPFEKSAPEASEDRQNRAVTLHLAGAAAAAGGDANR